MVLISVCLFYLVADSIGGKWYDCHLGIWNSANICLLSQSYYEFSLYVFPASMFTIFLNFISQRVCIILI